MRERLGAVQLEKMKDARRKKPECVNAEFSTMSSIWNVFFVEIVAMNKDYHSKKRSPCGTESLKQGSQLCNWFFNKMYLHCMWCHDIIFWSSQNSGSLTLKSIWEHICCPTRLMLTRVIYLKDWGSETLLTLVGVYVCGSSVLYKGPLRGFRGTSSHVLWIVLEGPQSYLFLKKIQCFIQGFWWPTCRESTQSKVRLE